MIYIDNTKFYSIQKAVTGYFRSIGATERKVCSIDELCRLVFKATGEPFGEDRDAKRGYIHNFLRTRVPYGKGTRRERRSAGFAAKRQRRSGDPFYDSREWLSLRYQVLKIHGGKCALCGVTAKGSGRSLHVDHIRPRSKAPDLALDINNLQVLCHDCNMGKSNKDDTDWRNIMVAA